MVTTPEYWELQKRKTEAYGEMVIGFIAIIGSLGSFMGGIYNWNGGMMLLSFLFGIGGVIAFWDANTKLEQLKHVMWTKQALKEYDMSKQNVKNSITGSGGKPIVEVIPDEIDHIQIQISETEKILENLDKRLALGEISEKNYEVLKSKYDAKLNNLKINHEQWHIKKEEREMQIIKERELKEKIIHLNREYINTELSYYKELNFPTEEENWLDLIKTKNVELIHETNDSLKLLASNIKKERGVCKIYYDLKEGKLWVMKYSLINKIHYMERQEVNSK